MPKIEWVKAARVLAPKMKIDDATKLRELRGKLRNGTIDLEQDTDELERLSKEDKRVDKEEAYLRGKLEGMRATFALLDHSATDLSKSILTIHDSIRVLERQFKKPSQSKAVEPAAAKEEDLLIDLDSEGNVEVEKETAEVKNQVADMKDGTLEVESEVADVEIGALEVGNEAAEVEDEIAEVGNETNKVANESTDDTIEATS